jgi:hypothetical protein
MKMIVIVSRSREIGGPPNVYEGEERVWNATNGDEQKVAAGVRMST